MSSELLGLTAELVTRALDAASLRQQVAAHNIANAGTPGYIPYEARFEAQIDQLQAKLRAGLRLDPGDLAHFKARVQQVSIDSGLAPKVALDMEAASLAETALHYQAVVKAYSQMTNMLGLAISEGRR